MPRVKEVPVAKKAVQELDGEQLEKIVEFGKTKEFAILKDLAEREKYLRYQTDFLVATSTEDINFLRGLNVGIDYILDSVERAKEELKRRGASEDEIDNEE